ncbi:NLR family member X1 [Esox lucius]|uniref:NACHT domain-containing protein n=1 Tax=Esox lucius TaxID=8010 RepID=A0A3P8YG89_ESOLU|nr:NLR family member X1 [Esox lucius]XP_010870367.2 NLR family member X1 [Esox lucius]XP_010870375.2 NLR family member X1 [Esox lucius]XP_010870384.2 NLR family member X1 [Esox lucius]XP_010870393.2 NLR family member X1 [Esox lucius]
MTACYRQLILPRRLWQKWKYSCFYSGSGFHSRPFCSSRPETDPIEIHKKKLTLWFSHVPKEEKQFGGYFTPETMHVEPLILEKKPEERKGPLTTHFPKALEGSQSPSVTVEQLFEPTQEVSREKGVNVLLYGAVGTGKSTVVRKLILDWCAGLTLTQFKLLVPFSCEDLSQLSKSTSLRDLVSRKYLHLKKIPMLSGDNDQAKDVLFVFNGMEKMKLDFRISSTELCSDPNEALPSGAVVVNLLRKYMLPEASILVTTRLSALDRIPLKYVKRYAQICGFRDPDRQRAYFASRLLQQSGENPKTQEAQSPIDQLYLALQRDSQLKDACSSPSYCWLTCATLHLLHFTDAKAPICTLTGIYTSFMRLNFGGEVLDTGDGVPSVENQNSLMLHVVRTVGKLAFDGVTKKQSSFTEEELEQFVGGKTKTDEELRQLAVFRTDVLDFFLVPCVKNKRSEVYEKEKRYVFAVPTMQEYLAALYVVLGENKTVLEKLSKEVSLAFGQVGEDVNTLINIFSKFIPLKIFTVFNLLRLFPSLFEKISSRSKGHIARTMAAEMFRTDDYLNEDVLDQLEQSLLGVHGPQPKEQLDSQTYELYPIFMGGLLHYRNRDLLEQLGCSIKSTTVVQITKSLKKQLAADIVKRQPPEELMDLLVLLYEFQNPRLTAEVLLSIHRIKLSNVRLTPLKCFILGSVLDCTPSKYYLEELDLSSCHLTEDLIDILLPAFHHTYNLNLQFNRLGPESCILLRDVLLDPNCTIRSLQLCDNPLLESGADYLLDALPGNRSLRKLSLMHTGMGNAGACKLAEKLSQHTGLEELNVAYNNIGDSAALTLVDACREHPSIHTVHLYLNPLSNEGKLLLCDRGLPLEQGGTGRRVKVLASVTEGSEISENWHPILSVIRQNALSWERERVREQLQIFLQDLEWGRQHAPSFWKKMHFRRVENGVRQTLQMLGHGDTADAVKGDQRGPSN